MLKALEPGLQGEPFCQQPLLPTHYCSLGYRKIDEQHAGDMHCRPHCMQTLLCSEKRSECLFITCWSRKPSAIHASALPAANLSRHRAQLPLPQVFQEGLTAGEQGPVGSGHIQLPLPQVFQEGLTAGEQGPVGSGHRYPSHLPFFLLCGVALRVSISILFGSVWFSFAKKTCAGPI